MALPSRNVSGASRNEPLVHNHSYENEFNSHVNEISFSHERISTKTCFEKGAEGNSEMAYWILMQFTTVCLTLKNVGFVIWTISLNHCAHQNHTLIGSFCVCKLSWTLFSLFFSLLFFHFFWMCFQRVLHLRRLKQWFSYLFTLYFMRALSVRAYAYSFLYGVAKSTYWRRAKPETFSLAEQIWHFSELFSLIYYFSVVSHNVWVFWSFLLKQTDWLADWFIESW